MEFKPAHVLEGVIEAIDAETGLYTVRFFPEGSIDYEVEGGYEYLDDNSGAFMGAMPEVGCQVLVGISSSGSSKYILRYRALPHTDSPVGEGAHTNFLGNRLPMDPGDLLLSTRAKSRVKLSATGDVEVVSNGITSTRWLNSLDTIQNFGTNFEVSGPFGTAKWFTNRDKGRERAKKTQTGFKTSYSRTSEGPPLIYEDHGSVADEEGRTRLGATAQKEGSSTLSGELVYRRLIFSEAMALKYAAQKRLPNPEAASFSERADDLGNSERIQQGARTEVSSSRFTRIRGGDKKSVWKDQKEAIGGDFERTVEGKSTIRTGGDLTLDSGQDINLNCKSLNITSETTTKNTANGEASQTPGDLRWQCAGSIEMIANQNSARTTNMDSAEVVKGVRDVRVFNVNPANTGQDTASDYKKVYGGKSKTHVEEGSWEVTVGPESNPIAQIKIHKDPKAPTQLGRITVGFPSSSNGITLSPDGSWEISGNTSIKADVAGNLTFGSAPGPTGHVVTTLTHPTDYFTGLPINGSMQVNVAPGPPAPLVGPPGLGVMPPTIKIPDIPAK